MDGQGSIPGRYNCFFSSIPAMRPTKPSIEWVLGTISPWVKRMGREADHSPPSSTEVKKSVAVPSFRIRLNGVALS
jgi:hypothetical protein